MRIRRIQMIRFGRGYHMVLGVAKGFSLTGIEEGLIAGVFRVTIATR